MNSHMYLEHARRKVDCRSKPAYYSIDFEVTRKDMTTVTVFAMPSLCTVLWLENAVACWLLSAVKIIHLLKCFTQLEPRPFQQLCNDWTLFGIFVYHLTKRDVHVSIKAATRLLCKLVYMFADFFLAVIWFFRGKQRYNFAIYKFCAWRSSTFCLQLAVRVNVVSEGKWAATRAPLQRVDRLWKNQSSNTAHTRFGHSYSKNAVLRNASRVLARAQEADKIKTFSRKPSLCLPSSSRFSFMSQLDKEEGTFLMN